MEGSLVEAIMALQEDGLDEDIIVLVLQELGVEYVDDVPEQHADYFKARCIALTEENER